MAAGGRTSVEAARQNALQHVPFRIVSHPRNIRFAEDVWELINVEAQRAGLSAAEFIRGAAVARAMFNLARREDSVPDALDAVYDAAQAVVAAAEAAELEGTS